jgi:aerobic-type carbon monoxide dehydrogenase small subunit (CoxS/CutS family)
MARDERARVRLTVNGRRAEGDVSPGPSLAEFLREDPGLTGTHVGCEHEVCGACTVLLDGGSARSCLVFAVQLEGARVTTIEGLTPEEGLSPLQEAFRECHGLQCGFCTPGMSVSAHELLAENPHPTEDEIRLALSGNQPLHVHRLRQHRPRRPAGLRADGAMTPTWVGRALPLREDAHSPGANVP